MFAEEMTLMLLRDNVHQRKLEELFNAGSRNFLSRMDYLHIANTYSF